jgi:hypothetical protein
MDRKFWIALVVVLVVKVVWETVVHGVLLAADYAESAQLWRPPEEMKNGLMLVVHIASAFFFTLIFTRGYEGRGIQEGVRYGFFVGMLIAIPMAYGSYAAMPMPYTLALKWLLFGLLMYMVLGALLGLLYGTRATVQRVKG